MALYSSDLEDDIEQFLGAKGGDVQTQIPITSS